MHLTVSEEAWPTLDEIADATCPVAKSLAFSVKPTSVAWAKRPPLELVALYWEQRESPLDPVSLEDLLSVAPAHWSIGEREWCKLHAPDIYHRLVAFSVIKS
jgi:hypothetical protein